ATLKKWNVDVCVENEAGVSALANNESYAAAGARLMTRDEVLQNALVILSINTIPPGDIAKVKQGTTLLGIYLPLYHPQLTKDWMAKGLTVFSMDMLPRTTRAQSMDVLSSQANIAGYKAVLYAAN